MNRAAVVTVSIAGLLFLSGCGGVDMPAATSPSSTPTASVTQTPTVSLAPATASPTLGGLILSPEGLGPLVVGQAPPVVDSTTDVLVNHPTACQSAYDEGYRETAAMWVANFEPALRGENPSPFGVWVDDESGLLRIIAVYDDSISTAAGIHRGSSASDVAAAYPEADLMEDYDSGDTHLYKIEGSVGDLYIDVLQAESVEYYPEIGAAVVVRLNVVVKGERLAGFNSDFILGLCVGP